MLSTTDKKSLEEIHKLFLSLEKSSRDFSFEASALKLLKEKIAELKASDNPAVARLAPSQIHLTAQMTLKHFSSFALPIERLLNKNLEDADFLVLTKDKTKSLTPPLPLVFVLDNIRSAFNVGSIFRTAETLHCQDIYLCGYTPLPTQTKVEKTALGTEDQLRWHEVSRTQDCLAQLKALGYTLIALETSENAQEIYADFNVAKPLAIVLGNERFGLDSEVLKLVDEIRIIPMRGTKNSLNVGVSAAIAGFEFLRQWKQNKS